MRNSLTIAVHKASKYTNCLKIFFLTGHFHAVRFHTRLKNTLPSVQCVFMFGVSPIEMIVEIALSLLAVMCNFHNHFCPAELLQK